MKTYRDVSAKIPNEDFRGKAESLAGYLDKAVKSGFAQSVLAKFTAVDGGPRPASVAKTELAEAKREEAPDTAAPGEGAASAEASPSRDENVLSNAQRFTSRGSAATGVDPSKVGLDHLGFEPVDGYLGDMLRGQNQDRSLFEAVSAKLKELNGRQHLSHAMAAAGAK
jgi:hypothetical protein